MKPHEFIFRPGSVLAVVSLVVAFSFGCSAHARSTTVRSEKSPEPAGEYKADEFVGVPIVGDYDDNPDLDFILEVADGDRTFKIKVHEEAGESNGEVLDKLRLKVNEAVDKSRMRVIGYYSSEYKGQEKEYGFMDLKTLVFYDEATGYEDAYFTDNKDSRFYDEGDVTIVYAPGHHYRSVYYPRYCTPWWDGDGDGIPDRYDPWPLSYDPWYDYNLNGFPDWYDPYYVGVYPYWDRWDFGFWVSYNWYSPSYFRFYNARPYIYYDDYVHYSRLHDHRVVTVSRRGDSRLAPNGSATLNVKAQNRGERSGRATTAGTYSAADGVSRYGTLSTDRRRYVPSNETVAATNTGGESFTRNRNTETETNYNPDSRSRNTTNSGRTYTVPEGKTKVEGAGTPAETGRTIESRSRTLSRSSGDSRTYIPSDRSRVVGGESGGVSGTASTAPANANSRARTVTTGRTTAPSEYTAPATRERTSSTSRYRGSYQTSRSGGYTAPSSSSAGSSSGSSIDRGSSSGSRSRGSDGSYTPSSSGSRSSSGSVSQPSSRSRSSSAPAPAAARPAPSSGGSQPAASSPSSGSRSRDSGSSSGSTRSSGSSGGDRRRK